MATASRSSVLGIKVESTEGTPVAPAATSDFTAMQDDFDVNADFDTLENAELKSSIGTAKPIVGAENPTVSFSHYLRHSGTEGDAPDYNQLLKSAFGSETVNGTQYTTTTSSTTTVIKSTGASSNFVRGQGLLIKDGSNGYSIRAVESVSSNDINIPFALPAAPASGIGLGKAVQYSPANADHQALTVWHYAGNGGAVQMVSGCKVTEVGISAAVGELLNATFSLQGLAYYYNPIIIGATDTKLDFTDDDGTFAATITAGTYKDPHDLAAAITAAMNTASTGETHTCIYNSYGADAGKFKITSTGTVLSLLFSSGSNVANSIHDKIGFDDADYSGTGATTGYTSDFVQSWAAAYTPAYDSSDPIACKDHEVLVGDSTGDTTCLQVNSVNITLSNTNRRIEDLCAESGFSGSVFNQREVTIQISALMQKHDAEKFKNYRSGDNVQFLYNFGVKSGGNWVPGKCGCAYAPTATITTYDIGDNEGLISLDLELKCYVNSTGQGEFYLNFL